MMMMDDQQGVPVLEKSWDEFPGHIAPATIFASFGIFALVKTLQLSKQLPPGRSFTDVHIPYRDRNTLWNIGVSVMLLTVAGAIYHSLGEGVDSDLRLHMVLYTTFFMVGLVAFLESKRRLPLESGRTALALGLLLNGIIWRAHGLLMVVPTSRSVHAYVGYINLANAMAFGYSIMRTDSMLAHIISWALMVVQGIWLYIIAFYLCCIEIDVGMVEPHLCLVIIAVTLIIVITIACTDLPQIQRDHRATVDENGEYEVLTHHATTTKFGDHLCLSAEEGEATVGSDESTDGVCYS